MKTILKWFFFCFGVFIHAQNSPFGIQCISTPQTSNQTAEILFGNCGNSTPYYSNQYLYSPQLSDDIIYLKLNFIFPTKPDGTGNFEQNNPEHIQAIDDVITSLNLRLLNLQQPSSSACIGYGNNNIPTTKIQFIVNKVWKVDPGWNYLYTGFVPCTLQYAPTTCPNFSTLNPASPDYYYKLFDNDPTIPSGINIVFANNGYVYDQIINNQNYTAPGGQGWAISMTPNSTDFTQKLRQFFPDSFNDYLIKKYYIADNPDPNSPYPNTPWSTVYGWFYYSLAGGLLHETGHNFGLGHQNGCHNNIMNQCGVCPRDYLSDFETSKMHFAASTTSLRQYFTDNSFKNSNILSDSDQMWDLNFRIYSNVKVDNNSSLKATCKIIMSPESRIIVKPGSNFIIEGADISSANNTSWNGIKIEGNAYGLILPDTKIDNGYFYMYTDNSVSPEGRDRNDEHAYTISDIHANLNINYDKLNIYPNPTGDFINIQTNEVIYGVKIFDFKGEKVRNFRHNFNKIDVQSLGSGHYILSIELENKIITKRFIKK
ncbi:T9SS type A sorting domain-containing protein [Chryseobacterium suipulveris]|uniref:T9SS type A sorting domain-containing protein n=1 Tax=Chryseobacterium suipulveris TaxID=2929800 RepID=A0ABY4BPA4_9FLAO|nr:T9SS type A sorting domain-containing protein [Chryseobacterium suipulveris]UOE40067.1 T9SS type A sorting domain-containing protein [Chryseobacterium suipulveris]